MWHSDGKKKKKRGNIPLSESVRRPLKKPLRHPFCFFFLNKEIGCYINLLERGRLNNHQIKVGVRTFMRAHSHSFRSPSEPQTALGTGPCNDEIVIAKRKSSEGAAGEEGSEGIIRGCLWIDEWQCWNMVAYFLSMGTCTGTQRSFYLHISVFFFLRNT